jgi:hypothetical protein
LEKKKALYELERSKADNDYASFEEFKIWVDACMQ